MKQVLQNFTKSALLCGALLALGSCAEDGLDETLTHAEGGGK